MTRRFIKMLLKASFVTWRSPQKNTISFISSKCISGVVIINSVNLDYQRLWYCCHPHYHNRFHIFQSCPPLPHYHRHDHHPAPTPHFSITPWLTCFPSPVPLSSILTNHSARPVSDWRTCYLTHESSLCETKPHYCMVGQPGSTTHILTRYAVFFFKCTIKCTSKICGWCVSSSTLLHKLALPWENVWGFSILSGTQGTCVSEVGMWMSKPVSALACLCLPCFKPAVEEWLILRWSLKKEQNETQLYLPKPCQIENKLKISKLKVLHHPKESEGGRSNPFVTEF